MPKIPVYESQVRVPSVSTPRPSPADFGAEIGEGLQRFGNVLAEIGVHYEKTRRDQMVEGAKLQTVQQLQELSFQLKNGSEDENGNLVPPPEPELHDQIFNKRLKEINDSARAFIGEDYYSLYERQVTPFVLSENLAVRQNAIEKQKNSVLASFDENTEMRAEIAAKGNADMRHMVLNDLQQEVDRLIVAGVVPATEGAARIRKFENRLAIHDVREDIRRDPSLAIERLMVEDAYPGLDPAAREAWLKAATSESERRMRADDARAERTRRDAERAQKDLEEQSAKTLVDADRKGELAPDLVASKQAFLSRADYEHFMDKASGAAPVRTVPAIYSDLRWKQMRGRDVTREALLAYENRQLDRDALEKLLPDSAENKALKDIPTWYKSGEQYINRVMGAQFVQSDLEKRLLAESQDEWRNWALAHPKTDDKTAQAAYKQFAEEYLLVKKEQLSILTPLPRFAPKANRDTINKATLTKARTETEQRFKAKEIDEYERNRQLRIILEWAQHIAREELNKPKESPGKPAKP